MVHAMVVSQVQLTFLEGFRRQSKDGKKTNKCLDAFLLHAQLKKNKPRREQEGAGTAHSLSEESDIATEPTDLKGLKYVRTSC